MLALVIAFIIQWIITPLILLSLLSFAWTIGRIRALRQSDKRISAQAGFWAGLLFSVIYIIVSLSAIGGPDLNFTGIPELQILPLLFGLVVGFAYLYALRIAMPTRYLGLPTLALSGSSSTALFTYIFISSLHDWVLYWTLGVALGLLLHIVFFPSTVREIVA